MVDGVIKSHESPVGGGKKRKGRPGPQHSIK